MCLNCVYKILDDIRHAQIQRGGTGGPDPPPPENHKNIGFLSNTGPNSLKITKLPSQIQCSPIIGTPAKRHLNGILLAGRWWPTYSSGIWILPALINQKTNHCQSWTPSDKTFWICGMHVKALVQFSVNALLEHLKHIGRHKEKEQC